MALEIVTTIAGKFVEPIVGYIVAPIARQVGYLIFYKHNFNNLKDQAEALKRLKDTIFHEVEVERRNGRQIYEAVHEWLDRVDGIVEEAEQLKDDPRNRNAGCCKGPFPDLKSRHQLSRRATKMAGRVAQLMQEKDSIDQLSFLPVLEGVGSTSSTSSDKLESRKKLKEDIVLALKDPNLSRIGVYGLGGVGKTTLVKEIAKQIKDDKLFDEVVMANISQAIDFDRIQGEVADFLGLRFEEMTTVGRASRLKKRIEKEKSILVILDDIWAILELDKLGISLNDHKGCKLLLTSRNLEILQEMETQKDFKIDVLNEDEAWSLFEDMVGDVVKDINLRDIAIQVAEKCGGLIVLIATVAKALKNKDNIDFWKDSLNQLKTVDKEGMNEKIYSVLEFSYNHLQGDDVKALFLLCGLLGPQSHVQDLLKYAMGLGIFKQIHTPKDARLRLHMLIGSLKASCLLLENNSIEEVKMHDIVHEVAVSIASRDQHVCKIRRADELWPSEEFLQACTQIIIKECHIPKLPERLECPNIKLFCLENMNESLSVPDSFFERMKNLKVLDLTGMHLPSLPQSFHSLVDLQTLCLDYCALGDMNNIGALINLQILSLIGSSMITLSSELGQLTRLKMLDLTDSGIEVFPSNVISKLTKLEELYLGNTSIKWNQEDSIKEDKNASPSELTHLTNLNALEIQIKGAWVLPRDIKFDKLERFKIVIGDVWEWSDNYGASKMLKLKLGTVIQLEHGIKELINGVEDLYLDEVNGISNVLYDLNGEGFPLLKHLDIQNNGKIQHIINSMERKLSQVFFPKLETLILQNLNKLEEICRGSFMKNSFANLRSIKVEYCHQLKYLFSTLMVKALCQLIEIEVSECSSLKEIVSIENLSSNSATVDDKIEFCSLQSLTLRSLPAIEDFYSDLLTSSTTTKHTSSSYTNVPSSFFNLKVKLSNLETLKLSKIHLENIWQDDLLTTTNSFNKLAKLSLEHCNGLKHLFSSSMFGSFPHLKELQIRECEMMEQIIDAEGVGLPKLETVVISNMKRLKKVWHSQFDGLKSMEVNNCEKLENIFPSEMNTTFGRMETLKVSDCGSVKEIFQLPVNGINSEEDTQLKKLHLLHLPKLKQIWSQDPQAQFRFHNLQDVHVEDCENLGYLFPFSIALDLHQLETLTMNFCGMNEIVAKKERPMEGKVIFHFDRLYFLKIWHIHKLDRFYGGSHSLECPSLRMLWVYNSAKLKLLERQSRSNQRENGDLSTQQQPLFIVEEVIPKLEYWTLNNKEAIMMLQWKDHYLSKLKLLRMSNFEDKVAATFLDSIVQKAPNLKSLLVQHSSLEEIFRDKRDAYKEGNNKANTQLERLRLHNLSLQHMCREECKIDPILTVLQYLYVTKCANLKTLVPSSVTFSSLTYLEITECKGLINLIYSSTATSLVNLQGITIKECNSLEEIVTQGMIETSDEILFRSLRTLTLESLPRLNGFSSSQCFFKFPLLKKVVVRLCARMKTFCGRAASTPMLRKVTIKEGKDEESCWEGDLNRTVKKMYEDKIAFRNMKHLDLSLYPELGDSWNNPIEHRMFCNLKSLVVEHCDFLSDVLIPSNLVRALGNLEEIQVKDCDSLEVLFEFDTTKEEAIHLRKISLSNLPKLQYIWKSSLRGEREEDQLQIQNQRPLSSFAKVLLPKLETIIIEEMVNLETIWPHVLTPNSMGRFETLKVKKCHKIEHIFPIYMNGAFLALVTLEVEDCNSVKEIFQLGVNEMFNGDDTTRLKNVTLLRLPKLKQIWSRDPQPSLCFKSVQVVRVEDCDDLEYIFPFSIAMSMPLLEAITIKNAGKMKEIVSKGEESLDNPVNFELNQLTSMVLWNLQDLEGFYGGYHSLSCSSLKRLDVFTCDKLKLFKTQSTSSQGNICDGNLQVSMQHPLLTPEEVMGNLEQLALSREHVNTLLQGHFSGENFRKLKILTVQEFEDDQTAFPYWFLHNMTGLEHLIVELSSFKEIFSEEVHIDLEGKAENKTRIKILKLKKLPELQHICKEGYQLDSILEVLEHLDVDECSQLKQLVPSSVTFNHMTYLEVKNCNGLIYLITSSTARSLVNLTTLEIRKCDSVEQIVAEEAGEDLNEIAFNNLEVLELDSLPKLQMFCSSNCLLKLPMLEKLVIRQCPRMTSFSARETSAPMLQKILTNEQDGIWCWEGDLRRTVSKMFQDMVAFSSFNHLELSEYPELKEIWYGQIGQKIFCNLKHLVVHKCAFLSNVIFSSNLLQLLYALEELEVAECDSLEAVFDVKALDGEEIESKKVSGLKKLTLLGLPNLKRIWNREASEIISFENLQIVEVDECLNLKYLFSVSLCQQLGQLEELHIESCGVEEIVSIEEGLEELKFDFPLLKSLELLNLTQLNAFYPKRYTLECPSLKILNVRGCDESQVFAFDHLNSQPLKEGDTELQTEQALFHIEKVSRNLEELPLNKKDTMRILNGNCEKNLFEGIKMLRLQYFEETPTKFLNDLVQIFPSITKLQARCSSFKILFPLEEIVQCNIESPSQIKALWLFQLEQLEHIWSDDDSTSHFLVQNLEELSIVECSAIKRLAPPYASFKNLTYLGVKDCNGLMCLMTSSTAKSLVHLTRLIVRNCGKLEEVVMIDEGESEDVVTFESLKYLELNCLSGFKSFFSAKHTFIFPSLVSLKVIGCHNMQSFSSGVIIAPFLKSVEVENGKKRWKEDLDTTIKQLFKDKAIETGAEGDYKESSSIDMQRTISRALSSEEHGTSESKADEIVDSGKQEIHEFPIIQTAIDPAPSQASEENVLSSSTVDNIAIDLSPSRTLEAVVSSIQNEEMNGAVEKPLTQATQEAQSPPKIQDIGESHDSKACSGENMFNQPTMIGDKKQKMHDTFQTDQGARSLATTQITEMCDTIKKPSISAAHHQNVPSSTMIPNSDIRNGEMYKTLEKGLVPVAQNVPSCSTVDNIAIDPSSSQILEVMTSSIQDEEAIGTQDTHKGMDYDTALGTQDETIETPLVQATHEGTLNPSKIQDTDIRNQETCKSLEKALVPVAQNVLSSSTVDNIEGLQDLQLHPSENLLIQATTSNINDDEKNNGSKEMHETIERPLVQNEEDMLVPVSSVEDKAIGTHVMNESIDKPFIQATRNAWDIAIVQQKEESHDSDIHLSKDLFNLITTSMSSDYKERKSDDPGITSENSLSCQTTNSAIAENRTTPSQASKPPSSSTTSVDVCSILKELDISEQLLPYLEAGVKRHPQVLNWLHTKRRRVFASSFISLFAEVTHILRTTRRANLTEENINYIRECCKVLQGVGFDDGWISYVHSRIEKCGDGEDLDERVEEAEAQLESMQKELASVEESLALLQGYMRLSTLINALLFTILFFIFLYVYQKHN